MYKRQPPDYVGNIMPMCQERRGEFKDMQYLDTNLVELHYSMPLGEIIYDFFDTLKARTKGYASLDYELDKYEQAYMFKYITAIISGIFMVILLANIWFSTGKASRNKLYARKMCIRDSS